MVKKLKTDEGLSLVELLISITVFMLLSIGVFQLFKLGFAAISNNAFTASQNGYTTSLNNLFVSDMAQSDGFVVSSGVVPGTKKADICSSWNKANVTNYADFTRVRPILTTYAKHSAVVNYAKVNGSSITYYTTTAPDFKVGQVLTITGLTSLNGANFNWQETDNVAVTGFSLSKPYYFTTDNKGSAIADGTLTTPTTTSATVMSQSGGVYTLDSITGIGNDMVVTFGGKDYVTTNVNQVNNTFELTPSYNGIPTGTTLNFVSTSNGTAETHSFAGYEVRNSSLGGTNTASLWRVTCQSIGQLIPDAGNAIKLRTSLPNIDTNSGTNCSSTWADWSCAIRCVQLKNVEGQDQSPFTDICPKDVYLSSGNNSFTTKIGSGGTSTRTDLFLSNSTNNSSSAQVGMSVNFLGLNSASVREYITAVDLTDPSGDAHITVTCVDASSSSSQKSVTCPTPPPVGAQVTVGASVMVVCTLTNTSCTTNGTNTLDINDATQLHIGMYIDISGGQFAVLVDTTGNLGSQNIVFSKVPSTDLFPPILEFHRPVSVRIWIPASSETNGAPEQAIIAGRASS